MRKHLLITGRPRSGKTTLIKKIVSHYEKLVTINGFWTSEVTEDFKRIGFDIWTVDGKRGVLARINGIKSEYKVGKYFVSLKDLKEYAIHQLYIPSDIIIIDEIGKMELFSSKFRNSVIYAFDQQPLVIATIGIQKIKFMETIKQRKDVELIILYTTNRERILTELINMINDRLKKSVD